MLRNYVLAGSVAIVVGAMAVPASAQTCDGPLAWLCQPPAPPAAKDVQPPAPKPKLRTTAAADQTKRTAQPKRTGAPQQTLAPEDKETLFRQYLQWQKKHSAANL